MHFVETKDLPSQIREISDPPKKGLYVIGDAWPDHLKRLCVVGTRKPSQYGLAALELLFNDLSGKPVSIVSGLALGIDAAAHRLAIKHGLHTTAFPGSGLDRSVLYPATNKNLGDDIVNSGGGLVSEYEPDQKSTQWTFPRRNRLMAGLADAILVIEATEKSGTLITARLGLDYNREVMAVPGSIFSPTSAGPHSLINDGAKMIRSANDILETLGIQIGNTKQIDISALSEDEQTLYKLIKSEPRSKDELIKLSGLDTTRALSVITMLELKNLTQEKLGKIYLK